MIRKRAIATVCMPRTLADKLGAAAEAGYQGVEIFEKDLTYFGGRPEDVRGLAGSLGLEIVALQPFVTSRVAGAGAQPHCWPGGCRSTTSGRSRRSGSSSFRPPMLPGSRWICCF